MMTEQDLLDIENKVNLIHFRSPISDPGIRLDYLHNLELDYRQDCTGLLAEIHKMREYLEHFGELSQYEEWRDFETL